MLMLHTLSIIKLASRGLIAALIFVLMIHSTGTKACDYPPVFCDTQTIKNTTGFEIHLKTRLPNTVNENHRQYLLVRFPKSGTEVNSATNLRCDGMIPNATNILHMEIIHVSGLPHGVTWRSASPRRRFLGGEIACFIVEGTPRSPGVYAIEIQSTGTGRYLGLTAEKHCTLHARLTLE